MKQRKKKPAGEGFAYTFHGAFSRRSDAEAKARKRGGFIISRVPRTMRKRRYIVVTDRQGGPF
jgi:hypothetical protein